MMMTYFRWCRRVGTPDFNRRTAYELEGGVAAAALCSINVKQTRRIVAFLFRYTVATAALGYTV